MIINTETHEIETIRKVRNSTGVSLPREPSPETLGSLEPPRAYVVMTDPPAGDVVESNGYEQVDGEWRQAWSVREYTAEELAQRLELEKVEKFNQLEEARKEAEQLGVTINGVRYSGDPSNRQALTEAINLADETGIEFFSSWKDSDNKFHADHPVADVRQALLNIAARRGELIAREGRIAAEIDAATLENIDAIRWEPADI